MISLALIRYVLYAALRDRLLMVLALVVLMSGAIGAFVGSAAVTEADRFALVFTAAGARFGAMASLTLFIVFYVRRAFDGREVEFLLSRPVSRLNFILSHAVANTLLALFVAAVVTLGIHGMAVRLPNAAPLLWGGSLAAELIIMANAAFFFSMVLSSAAGSAMATMGLYILGRLMGEMLGAINHGSYNPRYQLLTYPAKFISMIIPRLDLMTQSSWLVYGSDHVIGWPFILAQGAIFSAILIVAALIDLVRRQF